MKLRLNIVSRSSPLALKQVNIIKKKLSHHFDFNLIKMKTEADKFINKPLHEIGGKGLFVKELEQLLVNKKADIAIHSLKDMETELAKNTYICAVAKRESKHDVLVSEYKNIASLPIKASIGTSSPRRKGFLKAFRPDLNIKQCRGNVETRLNKLKNGEFDGLILAEAGLKRLKIRYNNIISLDIIPPAAGQGVIAIQCHKDLEKQKVDKIFSLINDDKTFYEIQAERSLVKHLGGSCQSPISSSADLDMSGNLILKGSIVNIDGTKILSDKEMGKKEDGENIGKKLAKNLLSSGGNDILNF